MPIDATPIPSTSTEFEAMYQTNRVDYLSPEISVAFDEALLRKKRAIVVRQNTKASLRMTIIGIDGNPVDLTGYDISGSSDSPSLSPSGSLDMSSTAHVKIRFRETVRPKATWEVTATVIDAENGLVICEIPFGTTTVPMVMDQPGIFLAEAGVIDADGDLLYTDTCYVYVESSAWDSASSRHKGPPSVDDLRLSIRDSDYFENELTENYGYGTVELCHAAIRVVQFWNDTPPPIAQYSTLTFPFREIWVTGVQLFLFDMAEEWYRRNFFKQQAGGVTIDDMNRHREYKTAWQERYKRFRQLVMHRKASINMDRGFASFGAV